MDAEDKATNVPQHPEVAREEEWARLMTATREGDAAAYLRLLKDVRMWLRRYYGRRLPHSMVEDATQDTLIAVHQKQHTYDLKRPFGPWLGAIARYKWIDRLRALQSSRCPMVREELTVPDHAEAVTSAVVLERLLSTLKPEQSEVIRLVRIEGWSIEEASRNTGQSVSLVKVNIHRGLARLSSLVQRNAQWDA